MRIYNTNPSTNTIAKGIIANSDAAKSAEKTSAAQQTYVTTDEPVDVSVSELALSRARRGDGGGTRLKTAEEALQLTREVAERIRSNPERAAAAVWADVTQGDDAESKDVKAKDVEAEKREAARSATYDLLKGVKIVNGMLITMADNLDVNKRANDVASVNAMIAAIRAEAAEMVKAQANIQPQDVLSLLELD